MVSLKRVGLDFLTYGTINVVNQFFLVFLVPLYTRLVTKAEFGVFDLLTTIMALGIIFFGLEIHSGTNRLYYVAEKKGNVASLIATNFWMITASSLLFSAILYSFAGDISIWFFKGFYAESIDCLKIIALIIPFKTHFQHFTVISRLRHEYKRYAVSNIGQILILLLSSILLLYAGYGLRGIFYSQLISYVAGFLYLFLSYLSLIRPLIDKTYVKDVLSFSLPYIPAVLLGWSLTRADRFLLVQYLSWEDIATYSLALKAAALAIFFNTAFKMAWMPHAMRLMSENKMEGVFIRYFRIYSSLLMASVLANSLLAPIIVRVLATPAYYTATYFIGLLAASAAISSMDLFMTMGNCYELKSYRNLIGNLTSTIVNLGLLFIWLEYIDIPALIGICTAAIISNTLMIYTIYWSSQRCHPISYPKSVLLGFPIAVSIIGILGFMNYPSLLLSSPIVCYLCYAVLDASDKEKVKSYLQTGNYRLHL